MTATDFTEYVDLARELIDENGRSVTFQELASTPADANKPWAGAGVPTVMTTVSAFAVFLPDSGSGLGLQLEDDELFKSAEQVLLVAPPAGGEDLSTFHAVLDDGVRWRITVAKVLKPGPIPVLYAMGVAR